MARRRDKETLYADPTVPTTDRKMPYKRVIFCDGDFEAAKEFAKDHVEHMFLRLHEDCRFQGLSTARREVNFAGGERIVARVDRGNEVMHVYVPRPESKPEEKVKRGDPGWWTFIRGFDEATWTLYNQKPDVNFMATVLFRLHRFDLHRFSRQITGYKIPPTFAPDKFSQEVLPGPYYILKPVHVGALRNNDKTVDDLDAEFTDLGWVMPQGTLGGQYFITEWSGNTHHTEHSFTITRSSGEPLVLVVDNYQYSDNTSSGRDDDGLNDITQGAYPQYAPWGQGTGSARGVDINLSSEPSLAIMHPTLPEGAALYVVAEGSSSASWYWPDGVTSTYSGHRQIWLYAFGKNHMLYDAGYRSTQNGQPVPSPFDDPPSLGLQMFELMGERVVYGTFNADGQRWFFSVRGDAAPVVAKFPYSGDFASIDGKWSVWNNTPTYGIVYSPADDED